MHRWIAIVVAGVVALGGVPMASAQSDRALVERFDRATAAGRHEQALKAAETIANRHEQSGLWAFNAACASARTGDLERAKAWIGASAERGFQGVRSFETNADLDPIRQAPEFEAALAMVRAAARARMDEFQAAAAGQEHPSWVPEGASAEDPVPLMIALHGTGGTGAGMLDAWRPVCEQLGVAIVALDALRPAGDGYAWTYRDESEWLIETALADAIERLPVDGGRVVLTGFSQGANIAMPMGVERAGAFCGVLPIAGHYEREIVDLEGVGEAGAPAYYFLIGARDRWSGTFRRAVRDFENAGVDATLEVVPGMGHAMPTGRAGRVRLERALAWCLARCEPELEEGTAAEPDQESERDSEEESDGGGVPQRAGAGDPAGG